MEIKMTKKLTPEQKEKYLKNPNRCPKCDSENGISGGSWNSDGWIAWQTITCDDCNFEWYDIYTLTDTEVISPPE